MEGMGNREMDLVDTMDGMDRWRFPFSIVSILSTKSILSIIPIPTTRPPRVTRNGLLFFQ